MFSSIKQFKFLKRINETGFVFLLIILLPFMNLLAEASVGMFEKSITEKLLTPQHSHRISWSSYGLTEEGEYILRIEDKDSKHSLDQIIQNIQVYIPASSLSVGSKEDNLKNFTLSSEERLIKIDILNLLREEGLNLSFKSKSPVYMFSNNNQVLPELKVYKIGPSKPIDSSKEKINI
ncbi:MAG: hypothetical protein SFU25_08930 [Candidatus Caenarcaniphilales bacterium]|nr:hypothetical protein [Candidatus Caenarcaniphilales bacterium]